MSKQAKKHRWDDLFPEKFRLQSLRPEDRERALKLFERIAKRSLPKLPFALDLLKLFLLAKDRKAGWKEVAPAVGGLLYFLTPIDLVPDFVPGAGYVDDAALVGALVFALGSALKAYEPKARAWLASLREDKPSSPS